MATLKVAAHSRVPAIAGAIAGTIRDEGRAEVHAIGAGAVNQAVKAVAVARRFLETEGYDIILVPAFVNVEIADQTKSALKFVVESR
jgi:stage V sporulation protein S